jgi:lipoate---protein ligase
VVDNREVNADVASVEPHIEAWESGVAGLTASWALEQATGTAAALHGSGLRLDRRRVRLHRLPDPALVLGSTQSEDLVDTPAATAAGVEVARRRSGGGVVHLVPGEQAWIDVGLPAGDPLWDSDVARSSWWLGEVWAAAVAHAGLGSSSAPTVHHEGVSDRELGRLVCFAAVGPGEVEVDGRKVVGISQRRTRDGARFQCVLYRHWDPAPMLSLLRLGESTERVAEVLRTRASAVGETHSAPSGTTEWSVVEEFLRRLP